ncbi:ATP-binding cassette domain-containing protein [Pararhizobium mangrovi]|uniref:ATP-binding cassette domain-containing protein n=1 Tax=Pararhizobium mangrovi TaxID=2590452 RepID=A0A506U6L9_9HYPH|nr:ATP-binding cassette domain-containing protein [Pararhizobium mangrovi]TPW27547.1 ATP-binding cassette domain-containing protein [Pararhizobium mangrovi]
MKLRDLLKHNVFILFILMVLAIGVFGAADPQFLSPWNLVSIARQSAIIAIVAFAMTAVIIARGIDISVGSLLAASGVVAGLAYVATQSAILALGAALLSGAALGLVNGALIGLAGVSPFIATLATMALARGLALSLSGSSSIAIADPILLFLGSAQIGPVPVSVIFAALAFMGWQFLLNRTVFGRWIFAVGGSATTASATGIPVRRVQVLIYVLSGVAAAAGTIVSIGRLGSAQPLAGNGLEFTAITAAIIGGAKLSGGKGSLYGTAVGAILLGVINTGLSFMEVPQIIIYFVTGGLILVAVLISQPESLAGLLPRRHARMPARSAKTNRRMRGDAGARQIELRGVGKLFPGVKALDGVSFSLRSSEVVALAGENGAGKSTLVKCLSGIYTPDEGEILLDGTPLRGAAAFEKAGISVIHQHFSLSPDLTVAENMFLGREPRTVFGTLDRRRMLAETRRVLDELDLDIAPTSLLGLLPVGEQQMVEIARAALSDAWMFIMDEPTSALSNRERDRLYEIITMLRKRGAGILYISHKMEEIFSQCDRVVVLRDGSFVGERPVEDTDDAEIIAMMVGREIEDVFLHRDAPVGKVAVEVRELSDGKRLKQAELTLRQGEIVALAGLMGSGRSEVLRCIAGLSKRKGGLIRIFGEESAGGHRDVVYVPEDRHLEGFVGPMSIRDNIALAWISRHSWFGVLRRRALDALAHDQIAALGVRPPQPEKAVGKLSGGNQQKVVIGKWLAMEPRVVLLDEPTRGVDVGAKSELHRLIADLKEQGVAILMVSSELPEIIGVADRIIVMAEGRSVGELPRGASERDIMALAFGQDSPMSVAAE